MNEDFLKNIHSTHFIGIGGIGVSAIARLMLARGVKVSGSDRDSSLITEKLEEEGVHVYIGQDALHVPEVCDLLVYSPAVREDNPELALARERGITALSYPEALGMISRGMRTIAVSGTHGKTTTTAMIGEMLGKTGKSPTIVVGSLLKAGTNFVPGTSDIFVVEACEYKRSFLNLSPTVLVITNIDSDHLDYYKDLADIQGAFREIAANVPAHGVIVCNPADEKVDPALAGIVAQVVDYTKEPLGVTLSVPGEHNVRNAKAALAVARVLGVSHEEAEKALAEFQGTWRRMELKGELPSGTLLYDDYAHHPTEIRATLQGFRAKFPEKNIRVVFQPHLYSRTKLLLEEFAESFTDADEVIVAPIYAARETPDPEISSEILAQKISVHHKNVHAGKDFHTIEAELRDTFTPNDMIVTMGAGDVYKVGENMLK